MLSAGPTETWNDLNGTLGITEFNSVAQSPNDFNVALGGSTNNGTELLNSGTQSWTETDNNKANAFNRSFVGDFNGGQIQYDPLNPKNPTALAAFQVVYGTATNGQLANTFAGAPPVPVTYGSIAKGATIESDLVESIDGGVTWTVVTGYRGPTDSLRSPQADLPFQIDSINPNRIVAGGSLPGGSLWESLDEGTSFASLNSPLANVSALALSTYQGNFVADPGFPLIFDKGTDTNDPDTIYIASSRISAFGAPVSTLFMTKNHGQTWLERGPVGAISTFDGVIQQIVVDGSNRDTAYVVISSNNIQNTGSPYPAGSGSSHVWRTTDAGQHWIDITTPVAGSPLPFLPVYSLVVDPRHDPGVTGTVYVGTDNGVYVAPGGAAVPSFNGWTRFGANMPDVQVHDLRLDQSTNSLVAGTYGRSMFQLFLPNFIPPGAPSKGLAVDAGPVTVTTVTAGATSVDDLLTFTQAAGTITLSYNGVPNGAQPSFAYSATTTAPALQAYLAAVPGLGAPGAVLVSGPTHGPFKIHLAPPTLAYGALHAVSGSSIWTGPVQLAGPTVISANGSQALQNGVATAQLNISGIVSDQTLGADYRLTKVGNGNVTLSGNNVYGGITDVAQGILIAQNTNALGAAGPSPDPISYTVVELGAVLDVASDVAKETIHLIGNGILFDNHFTGAIDNVSNNNTFTGTLVLDTPTTIGVNSNSSLTIGPKTPLQGSGTIIDGTGSSWTKELTGTLFLTGASTYSGTATVFQGVVAVQNDNALGATTGGTIIDDGAQLQIQSYDIVNFKTPAGQAKLAYNGTALPLFSFTATTDSATFKAFLVNNVPSLGGNITVNGSPGGPFTVFFQNGGDPDLLTALAGSGALVAEQAVVVDGENLTLSGTGIFGTGALLSTGANNGWTFNPSTSSGKITLSGNAVPLLPAPMCRPLKVCRRETSPSLFRTRAIRLRSTPPLARPPATIFC